MGVWNSTFESEKLTRLDNPHTPNSLWFYSDLFYVRLELVSLQLNASIFYINDYIMQQSSI